MVLIYGFGGFGRMLASILIEQNYSIQIGIFDNVTPENLPNNIKYLGKYNPELFIDSELLIAIGNNEFRQTISEQISHRHYTLIHPTANISNTAVVEEGCIILQNVVIQNNSIVNKNCIIQPNVVIDHDVVLNSFVHVYPNTYIGSNSIINSNRLIEPNSKIPRFSVI